MRCVCIKNRDTSKNRKIVLSQAELKLEKDRGREIQRALRIYKKVAKAETQIDQTQKL